MNEDTLFLVLTVARQIDGEYIFIKTEKAYREASMANDLMQRLKLNYTKDGKAIAVNLMTPHGEVPCHCEIGVFEVKIEK